MQCWGPGVQTVGQGLGDPRVQPSLPVQDLSKAASSREHLSRVPKDEQELTKKVSLCKRRGLVVRGELLAVFLGKPQPPPNLDTGNPVYLPRVFPTHGTISERVSQTNPTIPARLHVLTHKYRTAPTFGAAPGRGHLGQKPPPPALLLWKALRAPLHRWKCAWS